MNGWEVNLFIDGMERRKCCPGAHVRHSGVRTARRIVFPGIISAWAYPGGGIYVEGGDIRVSTLVGTRECFCISGMSSSISWYSERVSNRRLPGLRLTLGVNDDLVDCGVNMDFSRGGVFGVFFLKTPLM